MANHKSAKKRARQSIKKAAINGRRKSQVRTLIRAAKEALGEKDKEAGNKVKLAVSALDRAVNKGVFHKNAAARFASRLSRTPATK